MGILSPVAVGELTYFAPASASVVPTDSSPPADSFPFYIVGVVIGVAVASAIFVMVILAITVLCVRRKMKKPKEETEGR